MDIYTIFTAYGLLCIGAGIALSFVALSMPLASRLWLAALFPTGLAALITSHRGALGHDIGYTFATSVQFLAALLMCLGLLAFQNRERKWSEFAMATGAVLAVHLVISIFLSRLSTTLYQALFVTTSFVVTAFWGGIIAGRIARDEGYRSASVLQWVFNMVAVLWMLRYWVLLSGRGVSAFDPVAMNVFIFTGQFIFGIVRWFSYAAMQAERVLQQTRKTALVIREQAEELAERNSLLASAMLAAPAAFVVTDRSMRVIYLNAEAKRLFGATGDEMVGRDLTRTFIALDTDFEDGVAHAVFMRPNMSGQSRVLEVRSQAFKGDARSVQRVFVVREVHPDPIHAAMLVRQTRVAQGRVLIASDLTGNVKALTAKLDRMEPAARQSMTDMQNLWRTLEDLSPDDASLVRAKGRILSRTNASAMLRSSNGLVYHAMFCLLVTTDPDQPMLLTEIQIARSGLRQVAARLLGSRGSPEPSAEDAPGTAIPTFIRRS
jgi:PAS domain S-box-containing protein